MALSSTLFTGLSGLDANQTRLNVVGNNIANVNTTAFKASRALFTPQFYVTDASGGPADSNFGGTNPSQRGLGVNISTITTNFSAGALETTGKDTDLAIDGGGFFIVQGKEQDFTRDGTFSLNAKSELVTAGGEFVQGFGVDPAGNVVPGQLQNISIPLGTLTKADATKNASFTGNLNGEGLSSTGATILNSVPLTNSDGSAAPQLTDTLISLHQYDTQQPNGVGSAIFTDGDTLTLTGVTQGESKSTLPALSFTIDSTTTVQDLNNFITQGLGIDTASTLQAAPTPGVSLGSIAGQPANTATLVVIGNGGTVNALNVGANVNIDITHGANSSTIFKLTPGVDPSGNTSNPTGESQAADMTVFDSLGATLHVKVSMFKVGPTDPNGGTTWQFVATSPYDTDSLTFDPAHPTPGLVVGEGTVKFDQSGAYVSSTTASVEVTRSNTGANTPVSVALDFSKVTALKGKATDLSMEHADGQSIGTLNSFSIGPDGTITGGFNNGLTTTLGQVAIATFENPQGLIDKGGNLYTTGANSGEPKIGAPQQGDAGQIRQGSLEQSNVDLSAEFINLIVASTGFSAASRVITTADQLIQELLSAQR